MARKERGWGGVGGLRLSRREPKKKSLNLRGIIVPTKAPTGERPRMDLRPSSGRSTAFLQKENSGRENKSWLLVGLVGEKMQIALRIGRR